MPPGPPLPKLAQTLAFILAAPRFLEACRRRYGNAVTLRTLFDSQFVMVFDPALVKELFQGSNEQLHAGEANALLGPILGERSVLLLDGAEHLRHRRLLLPPFHGQRMKAYAEMMLEATDLEIESWPVVGRVHPAREHAVAHPAGDPGGGVRLPAGNPRRGRAARCGARDDRADREPAGAAPAARGDDRAPDRETARARARAAARFEAAKRAVDEILYAEIARRREDASLAERDDVFSALLLACDEDGNRLSDREVRDELLTLLMAGHETTATGLAWTFDLLLHSPAVLARAMEGDDAYLDAVVKESLRLRAVIPGVGRVVRGEPFRLNGYAVPPGVEINPSIRMMHLRSDLYPQPRAFRPERFLGPDAPDTYTWIPFGGGTRRCLGASFALMEMRVVLRRVLERAALRPADPELEEIQFRAITQAPRNGVRVVQDRPPAPRAPRPARD